MSSLWMEKGKVTTKLSKYYMPSPMCNSLLHRYAIPPCMEETYLPASCQIGRKKDSKGSMTVEAAVVAPLLIKYDVSARGRAFVYCAS